MFFALLSTFMSSLADVSWKKSLTYGIRPKAHSLWSYPIAIILFIYFVYSGFNIFSIWITPIIVIFIIALIDIIKEPVNQQVYKEEKISVIMPYLNLSKIFVIISSFFLYQDVSYVTFLITVFAIIVIMLASIDIKKMSFPRCFSKILFIETLRTIGILLWGWVVLRYSEIIYFNTYVLTCGLLILLLTIHAKQLPDLKTAGYSFWKYRTIAGLWWFSWFLWLVVIKNLGLSLSILLGFIGIWVTLLISYFLLWDKPSRKNIILTIVVSVLIWIWYYFK